MSESNKQTKLQLVKLTPEMVEKAKEANTFIKVEGGGNLKLSGFKSYIKNHPDYIYLANYRIAGKKDDIIKVLEGYTTRENKPLTKEDILDSIKNFGITAKNYKVPESEGGLRDLYNKLLEESKQVSTPKEFKIKAKDIEHIFNAIERNEYDIIQGKVSSPGKMSESKTSPKKTKTAKTKEVTSKVHKPRKPKISLSEKIEELPEGYWLDVSDITSTGSNAKKTNKLANNRVKIPQLRIASTNLAHLETALDLLNLSSEEKSKYIKEFEKEYKETGKKVTPRTSKTKVAVATKKTIKPKENTKLAKEEKEEEESSSESEVEVKREIQKEEKEGSVIVNQQELNEEIKELEREEKRETTSPIKRTKPGISLTGKKSGITRFTSKKH